MFVDTEDSLVNAIYALICCNIFIGGLWLFGVGL